MLKTSSNFARLEFVGKVLLMYLTLKLNMFFGRLLWTDDKIPLRDDNEWTFLLEKKEPWNMNIFERLLSCLRLNDLMISLVFLYWSYCTLVCVLVSFQRFRMVSLDEDFNALRKTIWY